MHLLISIGRFILIELVFLVLEGIFWLFAKGIHYLYQSLVKHK